MCSCHCGGEKQLKSGRGNTGLVHLRGAEEEKQRAMAQSHRGTTVIGRSLIWIPGQHKENLAGESRWVKPFFSTFEAVLRCCWTIISLNLLRKPPFSSIQGKKRWKCSRAGADWQSYVACVRFKEDEVGCTTAPKCVYNPLWSLLLVYKQFTCHSCYNTRNTQTNKNKEQLFLRRFHSCDIYFVALAGLQQCIVIMDSWLKSKLIISHSANNKDWPAPMVCGRLNNGCPSFTQLSSLLGNEHVAILILFQEIYGFFML